MATVEKDRQGVEHMKMHFHVCSPISFPFICCNRGKNEADHGGKKIEGPKGSGVVGLHLTKQPGQWNHEYQTFYVDIRGHHRIYLENKEAEIAAAKKAGKKDFKFLGVKWN